MKLGRLCIHWNDCCVSKKGGCQPTIGIKMGSDFTTKVLNGVQVRN